MKTHLTKLLWSRNAKLDFVCGALILLAFVIGCGGSSSSTPKNPIPAAYLGAWTGADGTKLTIRGNNTGDYNAGSSKVDGAAVDVDETAKEIKFTMLGVDVGKYKIDKAPTGNSMTLSGMVFKKAGDFAPAVDSSPSLKSGDNRATANSNSSGAAEDDAEVQELVKQTMLDFGEAVREKDFTSFRDTISDTWKKQITAEEFNTAFKGFIDRKVDTSVVKNMQATFDSPPASDDYNVLNAVGSYPTKPPTAFDLKYLKEDGEWKLLAVKIKVQ